MNRLLTALDGLSSPPEGGGIATAESQEDVAWRVGKTSTGHAVILYELHSPRNDGVPYRLAYLDYRPSVEVEVSGANGTRKGTFAILECKTTERPLFAYFLRMMDAVLSGDGGPNTIAQFDSAIGNVVTLFRALQRQGRTTVQGLWAELAIVAWAHDPRTAVAAWHSMPTETVDFTSGIQRLEVKSTTRPLREHEVGLAQLQWAPGGNTFIASLMLSEDPYGVSVEHLVARIHGVLRLPSERQRLETIVASSLGADWREGAELRFDETKARESVAVYAAADVPSVSPEVPTAVKSVRFVVDLSGISPASLKDVRSLAPFYEAVLPSD